MRFVPLCLLTLLSCRVASAQGRAKAAPATPIPYSRQIPGSVVKLMPRGAKTLFWGTFVAKGGAMGIHLFKRGPEKSGRYNITRMLGLDVFQRHGRRWQNVKSVPFEYPVASIRSAAFIGTDKAVDAQFFWIDPQRKIPMLKLRVFNPHGLRGAVGADISVAFPNGFTHKASAQSWELGMWSSSPMMGQQLNWSQRDANGFLQVVSVASSNGTPEPVSTVWRWEGQRFVPQHG